MVRVYWLNWLRASIVRAEYSLRRSDAAVSLPDLEELSPLEFLLFEGTVRHVLLPPLIPSEAAFSLEP